MTSSSIELFDRLPDHSFCYDILKRYPDCVICNNGPASISNMSLSVSTKKFRYTDSSEELSEVRGIAGTVELDRRIQPEQMYVITIIRPSDNAKIIMGGIDLLYRTEHTERWTYIAQMIYITPGDKNDI